MKKYPKNLFGIIALSALAGCFSPKTKNIVLNAPTPKTFSNPDLTLIRKEVPKYYSFSFDRAYLYFSTNHSQQTHAILSRYLCPEGITNFHNAAIGQTMKESEWNDFLKTNKKCKSTGKAHFNNWQKFYQ